MKVLLPILALLPALLPLPGQTSTGPTNRPAQVNQQAKGDQKISAPAVTKNQKAPTENQNESKTPTSEREPRHVIVDSLPGAEKDTWDKVYICLTGTLVVIAALTLAAIWYQALQTRKSVDAMERSTGIMMSIEQGRILTYWDQTIHIDFSPDAVRDGHLSHYFNWACGNIGKTEARLNKVWTRFIVIHSLADLPEKPDYSAPNEFVYQGEPLQPNSKKRQTEYFSVPLETAVPFQEMQDRHRKGECVLYAYGYARYTDVWGRPHEARFGVVRSIQYTLSADAWVVAGPSEYNKST
ncbi:MAG TPA: hypothetical protein VG051_06620 [Candidatus Acidoferrum sp.]|jgi:hypothetical protein|nr:hypothetical protein [Candidatus Acidoferrum sp.]